MHVKTQACFPTCQSAWCFPTAEAFVCASRTHLSAIWSRVWQCAESGCLLGYDRWPHRSRESLLRWPSTACHLERGNTETERAIRGERWRWRGQKNEERIKERAIKGRGKKGEESKVQSEEKHIKPLREFSCSLWLGTRFRWLRPGKWITQTKETLWWTTNKAVHTLKHVAHL